MFSFGTVTHLDENVSHATALETASIQASAVTAGSGSQTVLPHNGHVED